MAGNKEETKDVKVQEKGKEGEPIDENEIRVTAQGKMRNYVTYAASLFTDKKQPSVVLKGMGRVINKTVSLAEILKRRVKGLYQLTEIGSVQVTDTTPAKEEGEEPTETTRLLSVIKIILTTEPPEDTRYQPPLPEDMVEPLKKVPPRRTTSTGRGRRGGRRPGPGKGREGEEAPAGGRGRGRGRGRARRGRGARANKGERAATKKEGAGEAPAAEAQAAS